MNIKVSDNCFLSQLTPSLKVMRVIYDHQENLCTSDSPSFKYHTILSREVMMSEFMEL